MKIVIIGAGNVATHLAVAIKKSGQNILQIISKKIENSKKLAQKIGCDFADNISEINKNADLYIISVSDNQITKIASHKNLKNKFVVHTAGSISQEVLSNNSNKYGVFYPLQTFSKNVFVDFSQVPICIEANNTRNFQILENLAVKLGCESYAVNSEQRAKLHLSAVFVNNFTNYMFAVGNDILEKNNLPFEILRPLIRQTVAKIESTKPADVQTGPAIRGDTETIKKHLQQLSQMPDYKEIYELISNKISSDS